jgi:predicted DNA binding CopG/RHH family protein
MQQPAENSGAYGDAKSQASDSRSLRWSDGSLPPGWKAAPSLTDSSFAGLLAALATPAAAEREPIANLDDLKDDVATLSYENALRAHARYRPSRPSDQSLTLPFDPEPNQSDQAFSADAYPAPAVTRQAIASSSAQANPWVAHGQAKALDRNLKSASITIRMSKAECEQLHQRAAEAGLTVSAYLRSCTFEVESLRALVKDTLAQLRSAKSRGDQTAPAPHRRSWLGWLRFLPRRHSGPHAARA